MKTGKKGLELIKKYEGLSLKAYKCPAGRWTIGYGHTRGVRPWSIISLSQAEQKLREDVELAEHAVDPLVYLCPELGQSRYDALVCFTYNVGGAAFTRSVLRKKVVNNMSDPSIREEFGRWVYADGKKMPGLVMRRKEEADLYFSEQGDI